MQIETLTIENYKCFFQETKINLAEGFNLFVGSNNSGKTTALELLNTTRFVNDPHKSCVNLKNFGDVPHQQSNISLSFITDLRELRNASEHLYFPVSRDLLQQWQNSDQREMLAWDIIKNEREAKLEVSWENDCTFFKLESALGDSGKLKESSNSLLDSFRIQFHKGDESNPHLSFTSSNVVAEFSVYRQRLLRYVYRFSAQRRPNAVCASSDTTMLSSDASNLAYCINHLQTNDARGHAVLCEKLNRVFPGIHWIQAPPIQGNQFELRCLPQAPSARRDDLAIPLNQMGTGIGNVIAILYVLLTARTPQVIAIDEPNSFLHPKALRELMQILASEGKQHQFILSVHSPDVLTAVNPNLITMFEFNGTTTTTKQVDGKSLRDLRAELMEIGIRMTDLHSRDRVLWVEGQTEELVFPDLLRSFCPEIAAGTAVLRVEHTGTFEKKTIPATEIANIYKRLTESSAIAPPPVGILLDRETRKDLDIQNLQIRSNGLLFFLDRTMLENYILSSKAIHAILQERGETLNIEAVEERMRELVGSKDLEKLNGAHILENLIPELTDSRQEFRKTRDVPEIINWILTNDPVFLDPLKIFVQSLFEQNELSYNSSSLDKV